MDPARRFVSINFHEAVSGKFVLMEIRVHVEPPAKHLTFAYPIHGHLRSVEAANRHYITRFQLFFHGNLRGKKAAGFASCGSCTEANQSHCITYGKPYNGGMSTVNDETTKAVLAANIQRLMTERDWSVRDLARATNDPVMTIHGTISGRYLPRAGLLTRIAEAFETTVDGLLTREKKSCNSA